MEPAFQRLFTVEEANALLPSLRKILDDVALHRDALRERPLTCNLSWRPQSGTAVVRLAPEYGVEAYNLYLAIGRISELGVVLKDLNMGLLDFPHEREGRVVFLCWHPPEERLSTGTTSMPATPAADHSEDFARSPTTRQKSLRYGRGREGLRHRPGPTLAGRHRARRRRTRSKLAGREDSRTEDHVRRRGKMNRSIREVGGAVLAVSQFTLLADTRKGKRPSFVGAAPPEEATRLFDHFCDRLRATGVHPVETGRFGAMMDVSLVNDGPVTIVLER